MPLYNVILDNNRVSAPSLLPNLSILFCLFFFLTENKRRYFYKRGLLERFPPSSPALINLHSFTLSGCLVRIKSRSQAYNHLRKFQNSKLRGLCLSLSPLNAHFDVLAGWCVAGLERCSYINHVSNNNQSS
jgi:hypothetical protein